MSFKLSKCATCKKYKLLDEAPWAVCNKYPEFIPPKYFQNTIDSDKSSECPDYEYNPDWRNKGDNK